MSRRPINPENDEDLVVLERDLTSVRRVARGIQGAVVVIVAIITAFGTSNAHEALHHHITDDPWAWMPYPAFEIALVVYLGAHSYAEQKKARLAERLGAEAVAFLNKRDVWGPALRAFLGLAAVVLNVWWPIQKGDDAGAVLHALSPLGQVVIVEGFTHLTSRLAQMQTLYIVQIGKRREKITPKQKPVPGNVIPERAVVPSRQDDQGLVRDRFEDGARAEAGTAQDGGGTAARPVQDGNAPKPDSAGRPDGRTPDPVLMHRARLEVQAFLNKNGKPTRDWLRSVLGCGNDKLSPVWQTIKMEIDAGLFNASVSGSDSLEPVPAES